MKKRWIWIIAVLVWCLIPGCSVPDDQNWNALREGIVNLPPMTQLSARRWTANRDAARFFDRLNWENSAFKMRCEPSVFDKTATGEEGATDYSFTVGDIMRCLNGAADITFTECVERFMRDANDAYRLNAGFEPDCFPAWEPWFAPMVELDGNGEKIKTTVDEFDPDRVELPDSTARELVASPTIPRWLPYAVIGGVLVILAAPIAAPLCALRADAGRPCPGDPSYPPGQTPQPPPDGTP